MMKKLHTHKVTLNEKRRQNKKANDVRSKNSKRAVEQVFNAYYRDQVRALYRVVSEG
ncbi:MAG: hypothetical protein GF409_03740 [Candidatus Omnitrophica bacterium]|nr:hypothetical protein [Candidatus Omnitrophota bacterium]